MVGRSVRVIAFVLLDALRIQWLVNHRLLFGTMCTCFVSGSPVVTIDDIDWWYLLYLLFFWLD